MGQIENCRFCQGRNLDMLPCILDKKNAAYHFSMTLQSKYRSSITVKVKFEEPYHGV